MKFVTVAIVLLVCTGANGDLPVETIDEEPRYGGSLSVGTVSVTLTALSWDPVDWSWKINHDTGMVREQLFAADLDKSVRKGGDFRFISEAYLPAASVRGELAETWEWEDPLTLVINLRRGVMFPDKPGVMREREFVADDVLYSFDLVNNSPKRIPTYFDHIDRLEARDPHTVVFHFNEYNAEWAYRFGYGFHSGISPRETAKVDRKDWRNVAGSGPFQLTRYIHGNSQRYSRNPDYWDKERIGDKRYPIPFVDDVTYRVIKDEATFLTALRTGKLDILESIRFLMVDHLKETSPELKWNSRLATGGNFMVLRVDREPFGDVRVRRAINLAVNHQEIVDLFYDGHAELMAYPQHPGHGEYFQPLDEMPASVQELFSYNPEKARRLLAEAGYPDGFEFNVQVCTCSPTQMDLLPLVKDYLSRVGVKFDIQPMEYAAFLSVMTTRTHSAGYMMGSGHTNPTTTLRKSFKTGQTWNPSQYSNPDVDRRIDEFHRLRDEAQRIEMVRELTVDMLDEAPYLWLPTQYVYTAWWPWVKNYGGELRAGAVRPGPIYARIWIDQDLKRELGF
ncbi:MAG: ABC transporter substrate-binding protein [Gammaproteobacteria bacterium]|nr:ABC transporter substrate-binding protein [Gammaproteobacteria bacterium]